MNPSRRLAEGLLFTDEYQLTMSQVYFRMGVHEQRVQFDHFFRTYPNYGSHQAGYCVNAGLDWLLDWMQSARVTDGDLELLRGQRGRTGAHIFSEDFLTWLRRAGDFGGITLRSIPEGRVVHPQVPLTVVEGPLVQAQLLESALLNKLNFQTLIATKAALIHDSARGKLVLEFGLRRAHDSGANAATRAALIGGADFSSNVGMSHLLELEPKGTHAHSLVQVFMTLGEGELGAFRAYAEVFPDDCLLLVDTVDTLGSGVPNAIKVFEELRAKGHAPVGIRLDSGDLAYLSIQAAKMLDSAGFPETSIVLSNDLDELVIWQIISQIQSEAARYGVDADALVGRLVFGVGTRLVTSQGDSALGGVYKLVAVRDGSTWRPAIKISETPLKTPNPGKKSVWRVYDERGAATMDLLGTEAEDPESAENLVARHPSDHAKHRVLSKANISKIEPLLVTAMKDGRRTGDPPTLEEMRGRRTEDVARLDPGVRRLINPHVYHVSLTERLWQLKQALIEGALGGNSVED